MNGTRTTIEAGGVPLFEGEVSPPRLGFGNGSGSGATTAIIDLRWSDSSGAIQSTTDGVTWSDKIPFEAFA